MALRASSSLASRQPHDAQQWPGMHSDKFAAQGLRWWRSTDLETDVAKHAFPGLRALTCRELEVLAYNEIDLPDSSCRLVNVSQGLGRQRPYGTHLQCCTPTMRQFITDRGRLVEGVEAFHFQAISYAEDDDDRSERLRTWTSEELLDLAGNAFHGGCFLVVTLSTWVGLAVAAHEHFLAAESAGSAASTDTKQQGIAEEDLLDLDAIWGHS